MEKWKLAHCTRMHEKYVIKPGDVLAPALAQNN